MLSTPKYAKTGTGDVGCRSSKVGLTAPSVHQSELATDESSLGPALVCRTGDLMHQFMAVKNHLYGLCGDSGILEAPYVDHLFKL